MRTAAAGAPVEGAVRRVGPVGGYLQAASRKPRESAASRAARARQLIQRASFSPAIFGAGFLGETPELSPVGGKLFLPSRLVFEFCENLRGDGILLIFGEL